jgi:hypothetical protein
LPAAFSTLGYALLKGRGVEIFCGEEIGPNKLDSSTGRRGFMSVEGIRDAEDDILGAAKSFYAGACKGLGAKGRIVMYAFVQPGLVN